jgi:RNA polymerase sigma-70 factor (ECF subfamily)
MNLEKSIELAHEDNTAFKEIYDLSINRVYSYVLFRIKDKGEALDVCQNIYFSLWKSLPRFKYISENHFYAFLFKVARRQLIKARAKSMDKVDLDDVFDIPSEDGDREDYRSLIKNLDSLKDIERMCIELRYFDDLKFEDIALSLGVSENNARVVHHRAITKLRKFLNYE